ncbi:Glyoxylase, beta-lactamase superfamily II [Mameliella alba]|uniref:MBL fold metallo-hydrolase n=1 Tax=Mameliella alba TaxID=561184 RepID=UPI0008829EDE|nr:MBL fold metallo-hydrolase [Mameliella alba]OWV50230.1 MBL fold metallo-hydrolase [Mameliella alba]PTR42375.1 glyoxylase-like metal-dependent hydrolase (beta-lactamase superfamily II) [Mameliella alba]GGF57313.1 MBL fold metallo-hydrolase [Mameliella alba]SDC08061.1 Glyoxylase, beta-lactamase superfamily II [Mameliella alba]
MSYPVASPWYGTKQIDDRTWVLSEPHVHPIFSANIFLVLGSEADMVVDSGMGVAPLRPVIDALRPNPERPLILFTTHTHVDHIGAAHEFETRLVHPLEADELAAPEAYSLDTSGIPDRLAKLFADAGYPPLWPHLVDALPHAGYDLDAYRLHPAPATGTVEDGAVVDLGDWQAEVLHLPGHSPGQVGLWHGESGTLFGADAIYDGPLIYEGPGMDIAAYAETLRRIRALPVNRVLGGHDPAFGRGRCHRIVDHYLALWDA